MRELGLQPDTDTLKLKKHNSLTNFFRGKLSSDDVRTTAATPSNPVNTIASSVEVLYPLNVQFLRELEERMKLWPTSTSVGDIFIKFGPMMKLYSDFINNYERSQAMLKQLSEQQQFATFLKEAERKSRCRQDIHSLLIMPVQRLPRYQLLLKELLRFTHEEHVDYAHLKQASELATELNSVINENKRRSDCMAKMGSIQSSVEQIPFELVAPTRLFVDDVEATVTRVKGGKSLPRHLFLFSDCCILSTPFAHKKAKYCHSIHWTNDTVSGKLVDAENNKFGFFLEKGGGRKGHHARALNLQWQFWVQSEAVADAWLEKIETTLESFAINNNNSCANIAKVHPLVLEVQLHRANHLVAQDRNGYSDPYAKVKFKEYQLHSKVVKKSLDPEWNESFTFPFDLSEDVDSTLFVELWDEDVWRSHDFLGCCQVSLTSLVEAYKQTLKAERKKQLEARKSKVGGGGNKNKSKDEEDEGEEKGSQRRRRARSRTSPHSSPASSSSQPDESNKEPPQAEAKEMWLELDRAEHGKICLSMRLKGGVVPLHKTAFMVAPSPSASASSPPSSARRIAEREDATTNRTEAEEEEVVLELDLYQARVKMGLTSADGKQVLDEVKRWLSAQ
ncbi:Rho guanine nucleotide exchange factor (GEF) 17, variant 2 [Balamuthia mandrillaris]